MDPRRRLTLAIRLARRSVFTARLVAACGLSALGGCALLPNPPAAGVVPASIPAGPSVPAPADVAPPLTSAPPSPTTLAPSADRAACAPRAASKPLAAVRAATGRTAIAAANLKAREASRADAFVGGVQVFAYEPGRVYEIWTAPLRVTTLTLAPGETVVSKAAGDTVRWQIGETTSGHGGGQRAHVMIKPLQRGLETNLVLATSQRVYHLQLKSGAPEAFNAAVAWDIGAVLSPQAAGLLSGGAGPEPLVAPAGPLDARYKIDPKGRRPAWTPTAVMTDGVRTFLTFPPGLVTAEAPALFAVSASGEPQLVAYRQQGGLWVVDRVLDAAELRLGAKRPQVVRIHRMGDRS
jgi:type IV secretion system protein VirB9